MIFQKLANFMSLYLLTLSLSKFRISKTLRVLILPIQNEKFYKSFLKRIGNKVLLLIKDFLKILFLKPLIILITKMCGFTCFLSNHLPTHGFLIGEIRLKQLFQIGFKNGGSFLDPIQIFFVLK